MEAAAVVQRTESERSQNGPRVSFNRDVHVKRIGSRPSAASGVEPNSSSSSSSTVAAGVPAPNSAALFRRELPTDLSEEGILKEAAFVLAQAESVKCTAEGGTDVVGGRVNVKSRGPIERKRSFNYSTNKVFSNKTNADAVSDKKFHSLPTRTRKKAKQTKPVARSVSDVSPKKVIKRPSIFGLFGRRSDPNLNESVDEIIAEQQVRGGKKIGRSKSDIGAQTAKTVRKRNNSENEDLVNAKKKIPLSPIIEQQQREDYFDDVQTKQSVPSPVKPKRGKKHDKGILNNSNRNDSPKTKRIAEEKEDIRTKPGVNNSIKDTITSLHRSNSRTAEDMHSSQLPPEKPLLTKGVTVDGMVKRLSMERFSPPPHLSGPVFSYTRPKDSIIYAQVVCENDGKTKQTVHSSFTNKNGNSSQEGGVDTVDSPQLNRPGYVGPQQRLTPPGTDKYRPRIANSDEDEGLGFEIKSKPIDDDFIPTHDRRYSPKNQLPSDDEFKSLTEDIPITPNIRDIPPPEKYYRHHSQQQVHHPDFAYRGRGDGMDERLPFNEPFHELSQRREILESRIKNRRIGSRELIDNSPERDLLFKNPIYRHQASPEHHQLQRQTTTTTQTTKTVLGRDYRTSPAPYDRYQRSRSTELADDQIQDRMKKYHKFGSQEILKRYSPDRSHLDMISPNQQVSTKYEEESRYYHDGKDGYKETIRKETNIGSDGRPRVMESVSRERLDTPRRIINDDRQYRESSYPEKYRKEIHLGVNGETTIARHNHDLQTHSLKRQKKLQRSFDKGDSGIENDYRKDSFNDRDLKSKWKLQTYDDDKIACDVFLKKERRHTDETLNRKNSYAFRERSIDDGSHFDPRLDKYTNKSKDDKSQKSVEKKKSGLEKVKQLLSGGSSKKSKTMTSTTCAAQSTLPRSEKLEKERDRNIVKESEIRTRYHNDVEAVPLEPKILDISTRRRLSTPRTSPSLPKRTSSQKSYKSSTVSSSQENSQPKLGWFKSLDRLSRKKSKASTSSTLPPSSRTSTVDVDSAIGRQTPKTRLLVSQSSQPPPKASKNLRFFGDTDLESNASISKGTWKTKSRQPLTSSTLNRTSKSFSKSAYDLDRTNGKSRTIGSSKHKSTSLQHLDESRQSSSRYNGRNNSQSRDLHDISESASDNDLPKHHSTSVSSSKLKQRSTTPSGSTVNLKGSSTVNLSRQRLGERFSDEAIADRENKFRAKKYVYEEDERGIATLLRHDYRKPPPAPQKPARTFEKRRTVSRERDRIQDSSGTEGESSQSQRSVVYLHATTVGDIPQPILLHSRRRAVSRESLNSKPTLQPMSRTVSRSFSVLSPWKPKHLHQGYEINYSQSNDKSNPSSKSGTNNNKTSTLTKSAKRDTHTLTRYRKANNNHISANNSNRYDEQGSDKSSSFKSSNTGYHQPQTSRVAKSSHASRYYSGGASDNSRRSRTVTPEPVTPSRRRLWNNN